MKKLVSLLIIMLSLFYGSYVFAAENGDTTTTTVTYTVPESFVWTAPTDVTFTKAEQIQTSTLTVSENIIPYQSFLVISIPNQTFVLTSTEGATRSYKVYLGESELSVGSEVLRLPAGTTEGSVDINFKVPQVENIKAGTYTGTLNFVAKVTGEYTINYILNGGTNNPSNPTGYTMNEGDVAIYEPSKEFFTFGGWYDNPEFTGSEITVLPNGISGTINLYAKWIADEFAISYNLNGGTNHAGNPDIYTVEMLPLTLNMPTREGYAFAGWYKDDTQITALPVGTSGPVSLRATWAATDYTITYNLNGGTNNSSNPANYNINSGAIVLRSPSKPGYTFMGWTGSNGETSQTSVTISAGSTGNKTYTANWTPNNYTYNIVYKSSSGKQLGSNTVTKDFGTTNTIVPIDIEGYTTSYNKIVVWDSTTAKTIEFVYEPVNYTITYELDGGTNNASNPTSYNIETLPVTLESPTKDGYVFDGWSNGETEIYQTYPDATTPTPRLNKAVTTNFNVTAPHSGSVLSFDYKFNHVDAGDIASISIDDEQIIYIDFNSTNGFSNDNNLINKTITLSKGNHTIVLSHTGSGPIAPDLSYSLECQNITVTSPIMVSSISTGTSGNKTFNAKYAKLISFTIDGIIYQAEEGMTFEEWINSDYSLALPRQRTFTCSHCGESIFKLTKVYGGGNDYFYHYGSETKPDLVSIAIDSKVIKNGDSISLTVTCND